MAFRNWRDPGVADERRHPPAEVFAAGERNHHISNTAYPIAHNRTWGPYRVPQAQHAATVRSAFEGQADLCLYAHIPFCEVRCNFCEYTVVGKNELDQTRAYMARLGRELELYRDLLGRRRLHGFDIGGGTPAFVDAELIAELVDRVRTNFAIQPGMEISLETTPRIAAARPDKLRDYRQAGIDRISMGIQVIQPDLLKLLNRDGNGVEHHFRAVEHVRAAGFRSFNIDLMYGFANQSLESWRATLAHTLALNPEAITLYRMRYKLTRISHQAPLVFLEDVRLQAELAKQMLGEAGYTANPGKNTYCRVPGDNGTSHYITRRVVDGMPYLGVGLGAQTFTHTTISYNDGAAGKNLRPYLQSVDEGRLPLQDLYDLPRVHMMAKMICVSFYFGEVDRQAFEEKFGLSLEQAFPAELEFVQAQDLMRLTPRALSMTEKGARHFNGVCALFHAPSVQGYLLERDPDSAEDMARNRKLALKVGGCEMDFANILFGGPCNRRCWFCIGQQLPARVQQNNLKLFPPRNLEALIQAIQETGTRQVVFTGTVSDPQLYRHEARLLAYLRERLPDAVYSLHTNGALALRKLEVFNQYDKACISFPSFNPDTYARMMGSRRVPELGRIVGSASIPIKVSCLLTDDNFPELEEFLTRCGELGVERVVLRRLYGETRDWPVLSDRTPVRFFRGHPVYDLNGMEVTYWSFEDSHSTSLNLFPDGTLGRSYLIARTPELQGSLMTRLGA